MPRGRPKKVVDAAAPTQAAAPKSVEPTIEKEIIDDSFEQLAGPKYGFDILDGEEDTVNDSIEKGLTSVIGRRKNQTVGFSSLANVREDMLPLNNFYLQWALGTYGIPAGTMVDIIGAEGIGKTTLAFQIMGWAMDTGCPAFYIECENKQLPARRVLRALHTNKERALKMLKRLRRSQVNSLEHLEQEITDYVNVARGNTGLKGAKTIPHRVPIVIVVDPWSKLLNADEAAGFYGYGDNMSDANKAKLKASGEASNMGHSRWAHSFCRHMPYFLRKNNVILIHIHHQNDAVDMGAKKGGPQLPQLWKDLNNTSKIGGRAFSQNAAIQLVLARGTEEKNTAKTAVIGKNVVMKVHKNSFGTDKRQISWTIRTDEFDDTDQHYEPAISFDNAMANWMAANKFYGTSLSDKRFTCEALNVYSVKARNICDAFNANITLKNKLGNVLGIEGYLDTVETLKRQIEENARKVAVEEDLTKESSTDTPEFVDLNHKVDIAAMNAAVEKDVAAETKEAEDAAFMKVLEELDTEVPEEQPVYAEEEMSEETTNVE